ncbi:MAG: hypothetical protein U0Q16_08860 [Bryobacteraceae bacterium]
MAKPEPKPFPDCKISAALLHFAEPILADCPGRDVVGEAKLALNICSGVWNAVIFADVVGDPSHLDNIRLALKGKMEAVMHIEALIARKRLLFADDERLIGDWKVTRTPDGFNLRVEAREPYSLRRESE